MIQFNLLPDVKLEYIKATRTKRMVTSIAILVSALVVGIVVILVISVMGIQRQHLNNLQTDIDKKTDTLVNTNDINKVLTIQNQLSKLTGLHENKPVTTRLFDYIALTTPSDVRFGDMTIQFQESTITLTGQAPRIERVNEFVDTLKFTDVEITEKVTKIVDGEEETSNEVTIKRAFSEVVMAEFSRSDGQEVTYTINFKFDPVLFDGRKSTRLIVPKLTTTRSEVEKPGNLFQVIEEGDE